jgi:hypothetical protein
MNQSESEKIQELRAVVGFLMEDRKWWPSQFFESSSNDFLSYIFPKSINQKMDFFLEPIRHLVDVEVGANYYHLFRLPIQMEEKLFKTAKSLVKPHSLSHESALEYLKNLSEDLLIERHQGPINIGSTERIDSDLIQVFAAHYLAAFENEYKVHPYLN